MGKEFLPVQVNILASTDRAILIRTKHDQTIWVPRQAILDQGQGVCLGNDVWLELKEWFCDREGLE